MRCESPSMMCDTGGMRYCIEVDKLCDGRPDCPNGSDEGPHCGMSTVQIN